MFGLLLCLAALVPGQSLDSPPPDAAATAPSPFVAGDDRLVHVWNAGVTAASSDSPFAGNGDLWTSRLLLGGDHSPIADALAWEQPDASYPLVWPQAVAAYYRQTGDRDRVEKLLDRVPAYRASWTAQIGDDGLLEGDSIDAVTNARYIGALRSLANLNELLGHAPSELHDEVDTLSASYRVRYLDGVTGLFTSDPLANAAALRAAIAPEDSLGAIASLFRAAFPKADGPVREEILAACFAADMAELGYDLLVSAADGPALRNAVAVIAEQIAGLRPARPGWATVQLRPRIPSSLTELDVTARTPSGCVRVAYTAETGYTLHAPQGFHFEVAVPDGVDVTAESNMELAKRPLTDSERSYLAEIGWADQVGDGAGVWVSVDEQMFRYIEGTTVLWETRCATATNGTGNQSGSNQTPLGWHQINGKIGDGYPWGQVYRARAATKEVWAPGGDTDEDLVLTRVLLLDGLEPGQNQGGNVDSRARYIYVHGTNAEEKIGTPSSHGCIRLRNDDIIAAHDLIPDGTKLVITEKS